MSSNFFVCERSWQETRDGFQSQALSGLLLTSRTHPHRLHSFAGLDLRTSIKMADSEAGTPAPEAGANGTAQAAPAAPKGSPNDFLKSEQRSFVQNAPELNWKLTFSL